MSTLNSYCLTIPHSLCPKRLESAEKDVALLLLLGELGGCSWVAKVLSPDVSFLCASLNSDCCFSLFEIEIGVRVGGGYLVN